jgi:hypothetical protein
MVIYADTHLPDFSVVGQDKKEPEALIGEQGIVLLPRH